MNKEPSTSDPLTERGLPSYPATSGVLQSNPGNGIYPERSSRQNVFEDSLYDASQKRFPTAGGDEKILIPRGDKTQDDIAAFFRARDNLLGKR